jgi:hypothetical protein
MKTVKKEFVEGVERKHRQNRNTLASLLKSRAKIFWATTKGTYSVGKNAAKRAKKLKTA